MSVRSVIDPRRSVDPRKIDHRLYGGAASLISRREFLALSAAASALPLLAGCGGGGGGAGGQQQSNLLTTRKAVVKPNVVVLPKDGSVTVANLTDTGVTLSGAVPTLAPGQIIVSGQGAGLIRRVASVTPVGTTRVLTTEKAGLADVFEEADFTFNTPVNPGSLALQNGKTVQRSRSSRDASTMFHVSIPPTFVGKADGDVSAGMAISAEADFTMSVGGDFLISTQGIQKIEMRQGTTVTGTYGVTIKGDFTIINRTFLWPFAFNPIILEPIELGSVGPVPIVILPVISFQTVFKVAITGGWDIKGNINASYNAGLRLQPPVPTFAPSFSDLSGFGSGTASGNWSGPNFFTDLKAECAMIEIELATSFDGIIGPTFTVDIPSMAADLKAQADGALPGFGSVTASIDAITRAKVGSKAGLLSLSLPLFSLTLREDKFNLFKKTFDPGTSDVTVRSARARK